MQAVFVFCFFAMSLEYDFVDGGFVQFSFETGSHVSQAGLEIVHLLASTSQNWDQITMQELNRGLQACQANT